MPPPEWQATHPRLEKIGTIWFENDTLVGSTAAPSVTLASAIVTVPAWSGAAAMSSVTLAPAGAAVAAAAIPAILGAVPSAAVPLRLGFFAFAALACASGAKALRARRAPAFFYASFAAALGVGLLAGRFP